MTMIKQDSRVRNHRITGTDIFTVPSSEDFTDGSWLSTDLCKGEIGVQLDLDRVFTRTNNGIVELSTGIGNTRVQYTASQTAGTFSYIWDYTMVRNSTLTVKVYLTGIGGTGGTASAFASVEIFGGFYCDAYGTASTIAATTYTSKTTGDSYLIKLDMNAGLPTLLVTSTTYDHQWTANIEYQTLEI